MKFEFSQRRLKQIITEEVQASHHDHDAISMPTADAVTRKIEDIMVDLAFIKKEIEGQGSPDGEDAEGNPDPWIKDKVAVISALASAIKQAYEDPRRN